MEYVVTCVWFDTYISIINDNEIYKTAYKHNM